MDRLDLYRIFTQVIESRSFTKAADVLDLPRSSVSTAIADLERRVGIRLLHRTTRQVAVTYEGQEFYQRCLGILAEAAEMEDIFRNAAQSVTGRVRLEVPSRIGRRYLAPALPALLERWPDLTIDLRMGDRRIEVLEDGVDLTLRVGSLPDSSLKARRLGEMQVATLASPAYLDKFGRPEHPRDLHNHFQIAYASPTTGRLETWEWREAGERRNTEVPWRLSVNHAEGYVAAALAGMGLIQAPVADLADHLASGALIEVMEAFRPDPLPVHLIYYGRLHGLARLRVVADWIEQTLREARLFA